jgi:hypothetical protein
MKKGSKASEVFPKFSARNDNVLTDKARAYLAGEPVEVPDNRRGGTKTIQMTDSERAALAELEEKEAVNG